MLHVVTTGAYHLPVVITWKILATGTSYLTTGTLCIVTTIIKCNHKEHHHQSTTVI